MNIPTLEEKRRALLPLARTFAELPNDVKAKCVTLLYRTLGPSEPLDGILSLRSSARPPVARYERPDTFFSFGWSHGREKLQGKPDYGKGSFYANPQYDRPVEDEALVAQFAPFIHPNVWPDDHLP